MKSVTKNLTGIASLPFVLLGLIVLYFVLYFFKMNIFNLFILTYAKISIQILHFFHHILKVQEISNFNSNIITFENGHKIVIARKFLNLGAYVLLFATGLLLPTRLKYRLIYLFTGIFVLFCVHIWRLNFVVHETFKFGVPPTALDLIPFKLLAELVPLVLVIALDFIDRPLFQHIREAISKLSKKNYTIFIFLISYYFAIVVTDAFSSVDFKLFNDFVQVLTTLHLRLAQGILHWFKFQTSIYCNLIYGQHKCMRMATKCLGMTMMFFYTLFILLYRFQRVYSYKRKLKYIVTGILAIFVLNILRIAVLFAVLVKTKSAWLKFNDHHEFFNLLIYLTILIICLFWARDNFGSKTLGKR